MKRIFLVAWLLVAGAITGSLFYHFPWRSHEARSAQEQWETLDRDAMIEGERKLRETPGYADTLFGMLDGKKTVEETVDETISSMDRQRSTFERLQCWKSPPEKSVMKMVTTLRGTDGEEHEVSALELELLAARAPNAQVEMRMTPQFESVSWARAWDRFTIEIAVLQVIAAGAIGLPFGAALVFARGRAKRHTSG